MDQNTSAVLLSITVWALYVLLPLIPSIIIYKMFPETRVTAEGSISNWKIRAGGAFAAYLTVVLLGYTPFARTQGIIDGMSACTWTIHGQVMLKDKDGQTVPGYTLIKTLDVKLNPETIRKNNQIVDVLIPSQGVKVPNSTLIFTIPNFGEETIDLQNPHYRFKGPDPHDRRIDFTEPIVIKEFPNPMPIETTSTNVAVKYQAPLSVPGPTPLATATP
jgi:hypothetical protein